MEVDGSTTPMDPQDSGARENGGKPQIGREGTILSEATSIQFTCIQIGGKILLYICSFDI